jgi:cold shock CspA family protein
MSDTTPQPETSAQLCNGIVKWFNNKSGYGFITLKTGPIEGDIFVHHSSLAVNTEQYKYLVQGEYVEFMLEAVSNGNHEWHAVSVKGLNNGKLMCETRHDMQSARTTFSRKDNVKSGNTSLTESEIMKTFTDNMMALGVKSSFAHHYENGQGQGRGSQGRGSQGRGSQGRGGQGRGGQGRGRGGQSQSRQEQGYQGHSV